MKHQICTRCVMDTSASEIEFDLQGVCNFCTSFRSSFGNSFNNSDSLDFDEGDLSQFVDRVRADGIGKPYDCIVGVSGGVDSSWALVKAVELGLRPLAVHMDNGWNSELAVSNISNLIEVLEVDLYTHVIDWDEYKNLMQAFFDADVVDIELLYDNAMTSVCFNEAKDYKLRYILSGSNTSTEGIKMPKSWAYGDKWDGANIRAIAKTKNAKIRTFPVFTNLQWLRHNYIDKRVWVPFLDLMNYRKSDALEILQRDFDYKPYPYKHYESVFTRFYQGYLLPKKFGVDKRRVHLSSLIVTGQLERIQAIEDLEGIPYPSVRDLDADLEFFLKKMDWSTDDLDNYLSRERVEHNNFKTDQTRKILWPILAMLGKLKAKLSI